jgi:voltage-gated potassium channel
MRSVSNSHPVVILFRRWRYLFLLVALLVLLVVHPIVAGFGDVGPLFDALFAVVMLMLVLVLAQDRVWRVIACILLLPAATLSIGGHLLTSSAQVASVTAGHAIGALFFVAVAGKIIQSVLVSQELTLDSIFGAICGYLLLGVACALTYAMIYAANPESFQLDDSVWPQMEQGEYSRSIFIYYSFVTLTTVGYGDVTPMSPSARTLSWVEAMTGQMYLAVLVAGLISSLVASNSARVQLKADQ